MSTTALTRTPTADRARAAAAASIHAAREHAARCRRMADLFDRDGCPTFASQERRYAETWECEAANLAVTHGLPIDVDPLDLVAVTVDTGWTVGA
jgi:hypothetical protein